MKTVPTVTPYDTLAAAQADPLARPLTFQQVVQRTGRSARTISSWISDGLITAYTLPEEHRTLRVFVERQVLEVHREMNERAAATRLNLRNQRAKADAAQPVDEPFVDAEPTDMPPDVVQALSARMRPVAGPVIRVGAVLDTSGAAASLRQSAAVLNEAADRLEAIDGTQLGDESRRADV